METEKNNNEILLGNGIRFVPNDEATLRATMYTFNYDGETGYIYLTPISKSGGYIYLTASKWLSVKSVDGGAPVTTPYAYYPASSTISSFATVSEDGNTIYVQPNSGGARMGSLIYIQTESGRSVAFLVHQN
jgi:hypothetical protein